MDRQQRLVRREEGQGEFQRRGDVGGARSGVPRNRVVDGFERLVGGAVHLRVVARGPDGHADEARPGAAANRGARGEGEGEGSRGRRGGGRGGSGRGGSGRGGGRGGEGLVELRGGKYGGERVVGGLQGKAQGFHGEHLGRGQELPGAERVVDGLEARVDRVVDGRVAARADGDTDDACPRAAANCGLAGSRGGEAEKGQDGGEGADHCGVCCEQFLC